MFTPVRKKWRQRFCSLDCQRRTFVYRTPEENAALSRATAVQRGDRLRGRGKGKTYVKRNGKHEHRLVAEQHLGRSLEAGEIVHHRDEDKRNNNPDNLDVLPSQADHCRLHFKGKPWRQRKGGDAQ